MKYNKLYNILLFFVLGSFSLNTIGNDLSFSKQFFSDIEFEESFNDIKESESLKKITDSNDCGNGLISTPTKINVNPYFWYASTRYKNSLKHFIKKHLFLLYCCPKIDC